MIWGNPALNGEGKAQIQRPTNGRKAIFFDAGQSDLTLGRGKEKIQFSANGGRDGGDAGAVEVRTGGQIVIANNEDTINASARGNVGNGGKVELTSEIIQFEGGNPNKKTLSAITAKSGIVSGNGGVIELYNPVKPNGAIALRVTALMTVSGGISNGSSDHGSIKIELPIIGSVTCQQLKFSGDLSFPATYWNCVEPDNPPFDTIPPGIANFIQNSATKMLLASRKTAVFVFATPQAHAGFFLEPTPLNSIGYTFREPNAIAEPIHISLFESCIDCAGHAGPYSLSTLELQEDSAHELGHGVDFSMDPKETTTTAWQNFELRDSITFDFAIVGATEATSTRRLPCADVPNPAGGVFPAAFVNTQTGASVMAFPQPSLAAVPMCIPDPAHPGQFQFNVTELGQSPAGALNTEILRNYSSGHNKGEELYAQAFAFVTAANPSNYLDPAADGVFARDFYGCTVARARQLSLNTGTLDANCSVAVPNW